MLTPPLHRRLSFKRQPDSEKKVALLKTAGALHIVPEVRSSLGSSYPWQSFRDHHSTTHVLTHYHPRCLDNYEYFIGRNTTTMTLNGYRVRTVCRTSLIVRDIPIICVHTCTFEGVAYYPSSLKCLNNIFRLAPPPPLLYMYICTHTQW